MDLICPSQLDDVNAAGFIGLLKRFEDEPRLTIDFRRIRFAYPFATLLLAESVRRVVDYRLQRNMDTEGDADPSDGEDPPGLSYLKHVGFFQFVGLTIAPRLHARRSNNKNYIPIQTLGIEDLNRDIQGKVIQDAIERECYRITNMIVGEDSPDATMVAYCYREIVRNTFEHANIDYCTYMAQKWARGFVAGDVEIAIVDRGRGILESMRETYEVDTAEQAISLALQPGVSRIKEPRSTDMWANSGFGLYILSKIGIQYGEFIICSSGKMLRLCGEEAMFQDVAFTGTAVKLKVNLQHAEYFPNFLESTGRQGEEEIFQKTGERRSASQKSKML